jgi:hypothetical protein
MTEPPIDPLGEGLQRAVRDLERKMREASLGWIPPYEASDEPAEPEQPVLSVKKFGYMIPVLNETLMDEGLIPDTREPVKVSRYRRARWRLREAVASARLKVGEKIAGVTLDDRDDW